jgi:hypothetical protein
MIRTSKDVVILQHQSKQLLQMLKQALKTLASAAAKLFRFSTGSSQIKGVPD